VSENEFKVTVKEDLAVYEFKLPLKSYLNNGLFGHYFEEVRIDSLKRFGRGKIIMYPDIDDNKILVRL